MSGGKELGMEGEIDSLSWSAGGGTSPDDRRKIWLAVDRFWVRRGIRIGGRKRIRYGGKRKTWRVI